MFLSWHPVWWSFYQHFCLMCLPCWWRFTGGVDLKSPSLIITITLLWKGSCRFFPTRERPIATVRNARGQLNPTCHAPTKKDLTLYRKNGQGTWRGFKWFLLRSPRPQPRWEPSSAQIQHQTRTSETEPGGKKAGFREESSTFSRLSCASIRSLLAFWSMDLTVFDCMCVCRFVSVCVSLVVFFFCLACIAKQ